MVNPTQNNVSSYVDYLESVMNRVKTLNSENQKKAATWFNVGVLHCAHAFH